MPPQPDIPFSENLHVQGVFLCAISPGTAQTSRRFTPDSQSCIRAMLRGSHNVDTVATMLKANLKGLRNLKHSAPATSNTLETTAATALIAASALRVLKASDLGGEQD